MMSQTIDKAFHSSKSFQDLLVKKRSHFRKCDNENTELFISGRAAVTLTSTLDGRQTVCSGEMVTYTCTILRTTVITWVALPDIDGVDYFPNSPLGQQIIGDFQIALTGNVRNGMGLADLTITLTVTATAGRNGTEVQCRGDQPGERMSLVLYIASEQSE